MKKIALVLAMMVFSVGALAAEPTKAPNGQITDAVTQKNDNCVKKDKNGKCPPLPNSPKPTPKKKVEEKK